MFRSYLYVPANSSRFVEKAHLRGADAIILDLEDSVSENQKSIARNGLQQAVSTVSQKGAKVFIRVNNDIRWLADDLCAVAQCRGVYGIYLPKVKSLEEIESIDDMLCRYETQLGMSRSLCIVALIEDAEGVLNAQKIGKHPRVIGLSVGSEDFAISIGAQASERVLLYPKLMVHLAAKANGKNSIGLLKSIINYQDLNELEKTINEAKDFGFDGATCIHPSVVPLLNQGFNPSLNEFNYSKRLLEEAEKQAQQGVGAFLFEGNFVDAPIIRKAEQIVSKYKREE